MRRLLPLFFGATMLLAWLAASPAVAQLPQHNEEVTLTDADPTGQCSDGRSWTNTATNERFHCYEKTWHSVTSLGPVAPLAPDCGTIDAPAYSFSPPGTGGEMGMWCTTPTGTLVLQNRYNDGGTKPDLEGRARLSLGEEFFSLQTARSEDFDDSGSMQCFDEGGAVMICRVDVTEDGVGSIASTRWLEAFTDTNRPFRVPAGTAAAPSLTSVTDPTTGIYFAADERIDFATSGVNRFILSEAGPNMNATWSLFGSPVNTFTVNVSDSGHSGILRVTTQTTNSEVDLSTQRSGDVGRTGFFSQSQGPRQARLDVNATTKLSALDDRVHVLFPLDIGEPVGGQPTCDSTKRGWLWKDDAAVGVADTIEICMKDELEIYEWRPLDPPKTNVLVIDEDFMPPRESAGQIGSFGWGEFDGSVEQVAPQSGHPGIVRVLGDGALGSEATMYLGQSTSLGSIMADDVRRMTYWVLFEQITDIEVRLGVNDDTDTTFAGVVDGVWWDFRSATSANFATVTKAASTATVNTTTTAIAAATWYRLDMVQTAGGDWEFYLDGTLEFTHTTNLPTAAVTPTWTVVKTTAVDRSVLADWFSLRSVVLGR